MEDRYEKLLAIVESVKEDYDKLYVKGVKAASTRVRKAMQEIKALAQEIRVDAQAQKERLSE